MSSKPEEEHTGNPAAVFFGCDDCPKNLPIVGKSEDVCTELRLIGTTCQCKVCETKWTLEDIGLDGFNESGYVIAPKWTPVIANNTHYRMSLKGMLRGDAFYEESEEDEG